MWSRARGTFQYPDYDAQGKQVKRPQTQDTLDAVALRQHESKTDREARRRKEKMRELADKDKKDKENKEENDKRTEQENAPKRYIVPAVWEQEEQEDEGGEENEKF